MPLLLRLLLCLTLLANTAGGAWAAPAAGGPAPTPRQAAMQGCHDEAPTVAMGAIQHDGGHIDKARGQHDGAHDPGCCSHGGCDCLQHCGTSIGLTATLALSPPPGAGPAVRPPQDRGLPRPYQPVRPPIG